MRDARDAIVAYDRAGRITDWNHGAERLYERSPAAALGEPLTVIVPGERLAAERVILDRVLEGATVEQETERLRGDGSRVAVSVSWSPIRHADGAVAGAAEIARDLSARMLVDQRLRYELGTDFLTGLPGQRAFLHELARSLAFARRHQLRCALVVVDVDGLAALNERGGRASGDVVLRRIAYLLARSLRSTDFVARIGADEFAVVLWGVDGAAAVAVAGKLLGAVREDRDLGAALSASAGLVLLHDAAQLNADEMLAQAYAAVGEAKERGGGRAVASRTVSALPAGDEDLGWVERIEAALAGDAFVLYEQPIANLAHGTFDESELLVRLGQDGGEPLPPATFLPVAERTGQIRAIDAWVLEQALTRLAAPARAERRVLHVNVGAGTIRAARAVETLANRLELAALPPGRLALEIPEEVALAEPKAVHAVAVRLDRLGCETILDNSAARPGALLSLRELPVGAVKLGGELVRRAKISPAGREEIATAVETLHRLGRRVFACAAEDESTLALLTEVGVDHAQGFHLAPPVVA